MAQPKMKRKRPKRRGGRKWIFLVTFFGLALCLALFFFLRTKPEEKKAIKQVPPPSLPAAREAREARKEKEKAPRRPGRLALIIDDGGYNLEKFKGMMGMGRPVTYSILPNTPHGRKAALLAHESGAEVMLHLPMEPRESDRLPLEKDTVLAGMDKKEIQGILEKDLSEIPYVRGINNHMGSKATEDITAMRALMEVLKNRGLFYVDSHTSSHTVGPQIARQIGVAFGSNDRFLDHEQELESVKKAIRLAMKKAQKEGRAIAIGHPHPLTAQAIREMIPEIERAGIRMVFASEVVG